MVTIATADTSIAQQIEAAIQGQKALITGAQDHIKFRHQVHKTQPQVLVLDARVGGEGFDAIEGLPLISRNVRSRPLTIVLVPEDSAEAKAAAVELGAYAVVGLSNPAWLSLMTSAVADAWVDRRRGVLPDFAALRVVTFH